jgi:hypothetical protein
VGARRAVTSRVGASVADGREMQAAADDQRLTGQPRAIVNKLYKYLPVSESIEFCEYRTVLNRNHRQSLYALRKYCMSILATCFVLETLIDG